MSQDTAGVVLQHWVGGWALGSLHKMKPLALAPRVLGGLTPAGPHTLRKGLWLQGFLNLR